MKSHFKRIFYYILYLLISSSLLFYPSPALTEGLEERVVEHNLKNGLKVLMVERHRSPTVAFNILFNVGSVNEHTGITGIAHLYEHMAFKGTRSLGTKNYKKEKSLLEELDRLYLVIKEEGKKGKDADQEKIKELKERFAKVEEEHQKLVISNEIGEVYEKNGGIGLNASTGKDFTRYVVSLPSNRLELWAAIESDRLKNPVLREFYKEKEVVMEERRRSVDSDPSGKLYEALLSTAFWAHPYGHPIVGWMSDLESLTREQIEEFYRKYYVPDNAVIAVVGDIDPSKVIKLVEQYFGDMPGMNRSGSYPVQKSFPPVEVKEPLQKGERRIEVEFDAEPRIVIAFHKPGIGSDDDYVFDVIDSLLSEGRASRLYKRLVIEKKIAVSVSTSSGYPGSRYPNLFIIDAVPRQPHTLRELEEAIHEELERLKKEPVEERELKRILNRLDAFLIRSLESNEGLARQLTYYQGIAGDWRYLISSRDRIFKVTPEDVQRVARMYFVKGNRTVATLVKKAEGDAP